MVDYITVALIVASGFFVTLSFGLLYRYKQVSAQISTSNDLGHDLWEALEERMKKQDERLLDMMGRVEVIQARTIERQAKSTGQPTNSIVPQIMLSRGRPESQQTESQITSRSAPIPLDVGTELQKSLELRLSKQEERLLDVVGRLDSIQFRLTGERTDGPFVTVRRQPHEAKTVRGESVEKGIIGMLSERARTSVEIRQQFGISREHAARLLKGLFDRGLVVRNDLRKPFVYEITETGRRMVAD